MMDDQFPEMENNPIYPQEPPKKKGRLGLILGMAAAFLVIGMGIAAALVLLSPMARLARGAGKIGNAFLNQFADMPNLHAVIENYGTLSQAETGSSSTRLLVPMGEDTLLAELHLGTNIPEQLLDIQLAIGVQNVGSIHADAEVENRTLRLVIPQLLPGRVLTQELREPGKREKTELFPSQAEAMQAVQVKMNEYLATFKATKDGKETVAGQDWVRFTLSGDPEKKTALIDEIVRLQRETIENVTSPIPDALGGDKIDAKIDEMEAEIRTALNKLRDPVVYLNRDGYLCGLRLSYEGSEEDVCLLLLGQENPWSDVRLTAGDKELLTLTDVVTGSNITSTVSMGERSVSLSYADRSGAWTLDLPGLRLKGTLVPQNGGLALNCDLVRNPGQPAVHLEMDASALAPQRLELTGTETDLPSLLDHSSGEGLAILGELQKNLLSDRELLSLFLWFTGNGLLDAL